MARFRSSNSITLISAIDVLVYIANTAHPSVGLDGTETNVILSGGPKTAIISRNRFKMLTENSTKYTSQYPTPFRSEPLSGSFLETRRPRLSKNRSVVETLVYPYGNEKHFDSRMYKLTKSGEAAVVDYRINWENEPRAAVQLKGRKDYTAKGRVRKEIEPRNGSRYFEVTVDVPTYSVQEFVRNYLPNTWELAAEQWTSEELAEFGEGSILPKRHSIYEVPETDILYQLVPHEMPKWIRDDWKKLYGRSTDHAFSQPFHTRSEPPAAFTAFQKLPKLRK